MRINRQAYQKLVDENLAWLMQQPRTLEREHTALLVKQSVEHKYGAHTDIPHPCSDHHCILSRPPGMGTNGGCRCGTQRREEIRSYFAKVRAHGSARVGA